MKYIKIIIEGGCLIDVQNLPEGYGYELEDRDNNEDQCSTCGNPQKMYWCERCESNQEEGDCITCKSDTELDKHYHVNCN